MWYLTKADGSFSWYPEDWKGWCVSENTILTSFTKLVLVFCCHICGLFPLWWCSSEKRGPGWPGRRVAKYLNIFSQKFTRQQTIQNLAAFSQTSQTIGTIRQNSSMFDCSQIETRLIGKYNPRLIPNCFWRKPYFWNRNMFFPSRQNTICCCDGSGNWVIPQ